MHYMNLYEVTLYFPIPVLLLLDVRYFSKLSFYAISMNTNKPNLRNWQKNLVSDPILAQICATKFKKKKKWLRQSLKIMVSYHHVQYQKKLIIQSWENLVTDGQTDGPEWFHRMLSDCPLSIKFFYFIHCLNFRCFKFLFERKSFFIIFWI